MVISETDRAMLFQVAVTCTAQKAAISEAHLKSVPELLEEVEWVDSRGFRILKEFLEAWEAWFQFHVRIERDGKQGALSSDQETELRATTQERDSKRRSLMSYCSVQNLAQPVMRVVRTRWHEQVEPPAAA